MQPIPTSHRNAASSPATWILSVLFLFLLSVPSRAADRIWTGGNNPDGNWNTNANWGGTAPVGGDSLFFDGNVDLLTTNNLVANTPFAGLTVKNTAGVFTMSGNSFTLLNGSGITNSSASVQTNRLTLNVTNNNTINYITTADGGAIALTASVQNWAGGAVTNDLLIITNANLLLGAQFGVGNNAGSVSNTIAIYNSVINGGNQRFNTGNGQANVIVLDNTVATNFGGMVIGNSGTAFNTLAIITNGAKLFITGSDLFEVNRNAGSSGNKVIVTGPGSAWINKGTHAFALGGSSGATANAMVEVDNGAVWDLGGSTFRLEDNRGPSNSIVAIGGTITNVNSMILGNGFPYNFLILSNGGKFYGSATDGSIRDIGRQNGGSTNTVIVTGAGSLWDSFGASYTVGNGGSGGLPAGNLFMVANGGVYTNGGLVIGSTGIGNLLIVSNATAYLNPLTVNGGGGVIFAGGSSDAVFVNTLNGNSFASLVTNSAATPIQLNLGFLNGGATGTTPILAGLMNIVKTGTGNQNLGNANVFVGNVTVAGGTLGTGTQFAAADGSSSAFGVMTTPGKMLIATNGGTLSLGAFGALLNGLTPDTLPAITIYPGSTLTASRFNALGQITLNGGTLTQNSSDGAPNGGYQFYTNVTVAGSAGSAISVGANNQLNNLYNGSAGGTTFNVADTASGGADLTVTAGFEDYFDGANQFPGAMIKAGAGDMECLGTNTYTGPTTILQGTLGINSASPQAGGITAMDGTTLVVIVSGTTQMTPSTLILGSGAGATNQFVNLANTTVAPVVAGNLVVNGTATVNIAFPVISSGNTYPLITYTTISGTGSFVLAAGRPGSVLNLVTNDNGDGTHTIGLNVNVYPLPGTDLWSGAINGNWDRATANWTAGGGSSLYFDLDNVIFTNGTSQTNVTIVGALTPGSVTVNSDENYSFTGINGGHISGSGGLNKAGTGSLTLSGLVNTYSGTNIVNGGTVIVNADSNLGASSNNLVLNNGALSAVASFSLVTNRTLFLGPATGSGTGTIDVASGQTLTFAGLVADHDAGTGSLVKTGAGTLSLSGSNTYSGNTLVNAGKLITTTAQQGGGAFTVNDGAALTVQASGGAAIPMSALNLGTAGATTLNLFGVSGTNAPITAGTLTAVGTVTLNISGGTQVGETPLIRYSSFSGSVANFAVAPLAPQVNAVVTNNTTTKTISLFITSVGGVTWRGTNGPNWDIGTTTNWAVGSTPTIYIDQGPVLFDSTGVGNVSIRTLVSPAGVTVSNTASVIYNFTAVSANAGIGGAGGLVKLGAGTLNFNNVTNSYSGVTTIGNGVVALAAHPANANGALMLELSTNTIVLTNNASLEPAGVGGSGTVWPQIFLNPLVLNGGFIFAKDGGQHFIGPVAIGAAGTALGQQQNNKRLYLDGPVSGSGPIAIPLFGGITDPNHTPGGSGYSGVEFSCPTNPYNGTITLYTGHIGLGDVEGTTLANATVNLLGFTANAGIGNPILWPSNQTASISLGGLSGTAPLNLTDPLGFEVSLTLSNNASTLVYSGALADNNTGATVTKNGSGTEWWIGTNPYPGATLINNGVLGISTLHAGNGSFTVADGAGFAITNLPLVVTNLDGTTNFLNTTALVSSLSMGSVGATSLEFQNVSNSVAPLVNVGTLTVNGSSTVKITGTDGMLAGAEYPLIGYSSFVGNGSLLLSLPAGLSAILTNDTTHQWIALNVTSVGPGVNPNPPVLQFSLSGNTLSLGWPTNLGWILQSNSVSLTASNQWFTIPGSSSVTNSSITLDPTKFNVFFRMVHP